MMSSKPLWREPAGASTESVTSRSIESLETPGPRRRFDPSLVSSCPSRSGRSVAFSIPEGLCGGRGGKPLSRAISSFSVWFSTRSPANAALTFPFSARSRSTSPSNRRTKPTSSVGVMRSSESLAPGDMPGFNQVFVNPPFPPGNLPRLRNGAQPLESMEPLIKTAPASRSPRPLLRGLHKIDEAAEKIVAVAGSGRGLGMVLHREGRAVGERHAAVRAVEQRDMGLLGVGRKRRAVHREAVVHRNDLDFPRGEVLDRMVGPVMALQHFYRTRPDGEAEELMAEADAEEGDPRLQKRPDGRHRVFAGRGRIARAVRQEDPVGPERQN